MKRRCLVLSLALLSVSGYAYERLQGPTEVLYWNPTQTCNGYTFFGTQGTTYLIDMEGRVVHTWPVGTNPRLLDNGHVLDVTNSNTFVELDWNGSGVWSCTEARTNYSPHGDFLRIYNPKTGTNTTLYIANKSVSANQCIAAGCDPASGSYTDVTVDAIVEVDSTGTVIWEWSFFEHGCQNLDAGKPNYVASVSNAPGRINLNLPGRPLTNDWLHCVSLDYNQALDQIVITAEGGEFYVIDHGNTFTAGNPAASIALAASTNGDFLYRFGDPARYNQGTPPSVTLNWTKSTTGHKQIGGVGQATWIPTNTPGAGHFLVFNNGQDLFETTPQSYVFEVNACLNAGGTDTGAYVNPPAAGYNTWSPPGHDTDKEKKSISRQVVSTFMAMANQAFFSHLGGSVQRLTNGNLFVCSAAEGHLFEVTPASNVVWEYISPVTTNGIVTYQRDNGPLYNAVSRATRYSPTCSAFAGHTLIGSNTIARTAPTYISAPTLSGVTNSPALPYSNNAVSVTAHITNNLSVASATMVYMVGTSTWSVAMASSGALYSASIPAFPAGTVVRYYATAKDDFDNASTAPVNAPVDAFAYTVGASVFATNAALTPVVTNLHFAESPAADTAGNVFFSDIPGDTTYKWSTSGQLSVFRTNTGGANGLCFNSAGNLIACEGRNGRVVCISPQTNISVVTETYDRTRYNEPNDLWIDPDGGIYFTDPVFFTNEIPQGGQHVYYVKPDTSGVVRVASDLVRPNGLAGTPDGKTLYIADWGAGVIYRYAVAADGTLSNKTAFANVKCDGMAMDSEGNLYLTETAVLVYSAAGTFLEQLAVPARPTNLEFGGMDRKTLFITTENGSLYSIRMRVAGLSAGTNLPPAIASVTQSPAAPTHADPVTLVALATDDVGVASVTLTYSLGTGLAMTNTVLTETMATNAARPWTGTGCDQAWTVAYKSVNPFEQAANANCGAGNTNGLSFKNGTTNLADSSITTVNAIRAQGSSGTVAFYLQTSVVSSNVAWAMQLNPGTGFSTRLSGQTTTNQNWQPYSYPLQPGDLVSNLLLRFLFSEGNVSNRIFLDQISVKVETSGSVSSNLAMNSAGSDRYAAQIPPQTNGARVSYTITVLDALGLSVTTGGSYQVSDAGAYPVASFDATPTHGGAPLAVAFTDTSAGMITNRLWTFGDGGATSTTASAVTHTYGLPGTNSVQLIVRGPLGASTNAREGVVVALSVDTIGDGIPDWWRAQWFCTDGRTTNDQSRGDGDPDGDGMSNWQEFAADTNPTNNASLLAIVDVQPETGGVQLVWIGGSSATQVVESCDHLADTNETWTELLTNVPPTAVTNAATATDGQGGGRRFYRIRAWR